MNEQTEEDAWAPIIEAARRAATFVARRNFDLDSDDVYGEIITWAVEHRTKLDGLDANMRVYVLKRVGGEWAEKERRRGIVDSGQYIYTPDIVRTALARWYYDSATRETLPGREEIHGCGDHSSPAVTVWDLDQAMERLPDRYRSVIERRYLLGDDMSADKDRKAVSRAIEKLTWTLNYSLQAQARDYYRGRRSPAGEVT